MCVYVHVGVRVCGVGGACMWHVGESLVEMWMQAGMVKGVEKGARPFLCISIYRMV